MEVRLRTNRAAHCARFTPLSLTELPSRLLVGSAHLSRVTSPAHNDTQPVDCVVCCCTGSSPLPNIKTVPIPFSPQHVRPSASSQSKSIYASAAAAATRTSSEYAGPAAATNAVGMAADCSDSVLIATGD